jgi:hypothetical protein
MRRSLPRFAMLAARPAHFEPQLLDQVVIAERRAAAAHEHDSAAIRREGRVRVLAGHVRDAHGLPAAEGPPPDVAASAVVPRRVHELAAVR